MRTCQSRHRVLVNERGPLAVEEDQGGIRLGRSQRLKATFRGGGGVENVSASVTSFANGDVMIVVLVNGCGVAGGCLIPGYCLLASRFAHAAFYAVALCRCHHRQCPVRETSFWDRGLSFHSRVSAPLALLYSRCRSLLLLVA